MTKALEGVELTLTITLVNPIAGVMFALQRGKDELVDAVLSTGKSTTFTLAARCVLDTESDTVDFRGPFVQGPRGARFIYVNSGTYAGQSASPYGRRAKIPLAGISVEHAERATKDTERKLRASIAGKARDGGPPAATVALIDGWSL